MLHKQAFDTAEQLPWQDFCNHGLDKLQDLLQGRLWTALARCSNQQLPLLPPLQSKAKRA